MQPDHSCSRSLGRSLWLPSNSVRIYEYSDDPQFDKLRNCQNAAIVRPRGAQTRAGERGKPTNQQVTKSAASEAQGRIDMYVFASRANFREAGKTCKRTPKWTVFNRKLIDSRTHARTANSFTPRQQARGNEMFWKLEGEGKG